MKLFLDQGTPLQAAELFRQAGHDALHTGEVGMARAADDEILAHAKRENRIVISLDRDFPQLLALARAASPSIIHVRRQGLSAQSFYELVAAVLVEFADGLSQGGVVSVGQGQPRYRRLPLR